MKKTLWLALVAMLLTACNPMSMLRVSPGQAGWNPETFQGFNPNTLSKPDRELVNLWIINNKIVIDQEPIRIPPGVNNVVIYFALEAGAQGGVFPADGVVINDGGALPSRPDCKPVPIAPRKLFRCAYTRTGAISRPFKYSVHVTRDSGDLDTTLDPTIMND